MQASEGFQVALRSKFMTIYQLRDNKCLEHPSERFENIYHIKNEQETHRN